FDTTAPAPGRSLFPGDRAMAQSQSNRQTGNPDNDRRTEFEACLPRIRRYLSRAFRNLPGEFREECIQEGVANCYVRFVGLVRQNRAGVATPASLARFAVRQIRSGRRVAERMNIRDPLSRYCQIRTGVRIRSIPSEDSPHDRWIESAIATRQSSIPDQVALRVDVPAWLQRFSRRTRRIARDMSMGWTTAELALRYQLSAARISQMRREFFESWNDFQANDRKAAANAT
ncbi:MAG: hypothetical protein KDA75_13670, partial [Planctomycetaceae bacterium]|nr:hypothetical protein [Planctomycetaceae bacterium]